MVQLICVEIGGQTVYVANVGLQQSVAELKDEIKIMTTFGSPFDACKIDLYLAKSCTSSGDQWLDFEDHLPQLEQLKISKDMRATYMKKELLMDPTCLLFEYFSPPLVVEAGVIHVVVKLPCVGPEVRKLMLPFTVVNSTREAFKAEAHRQRKGCAMGLVDQGTPPLRPLPTSVSDDLVPEQKLELARELHSKLANRDFMFGPTWLWDKYHSRHSMMVLCVMMEVPLKRFVEPRKPSFGDKLRSFVLQRKDKRGTGGHASLIADGSYTLSVARVGDDQDHRIHAIGINGREGNAELMRKVVAFVGNGDIYLAKARGNCNAHWLKAGDADLIDLQRTFIPYEVEEKYLGKRFAPANTTRIHEHFRGLPQEDGVVHLLVRTKRPWYLALHFWSRKNVYSPVKAVVLVLCVGCIVSSIVLLADAVKTTGTVYNAF